MGARGDGEGAQRSGGSLPACNAHGVCAESSERRERKSYFGFCLFQGVSCDRSAREMFAMATFLRIQASQSAGCP